MIKLELDRSLDVFRIFLLIEALARETSDPAQLTIENQEISYPETVSLGLEQEMYREIYPLGQNCLISAEFPNGSSVTYSHWEPFTLNVAGTDAFVEYVRRRTQQPVSCAEASARVIAFDAGRQLLKLPSKEAVRRLFRAASARSASLSLTDANLNGKLVRITSSWMIGSYDQPLDVILRFAQGGWLVYHTATGITYATDTLYHECRAILNEIQK